MPDFCISTQWSITPKCKIENLTRRASSEYRVAPCECATHKTFEQHHIVKYAVRDASRSHATGSDSPMGTSDFVAASSLKYITHTSTKGQPRPPSRPLQSIVRVRPHASGPRSASHSITPLLSLCASGCAGFMPRKVELNHPLNIPPGALIS